MQLTQPIKALASIACQIRLLADWTMADCDTVALQEDMVFFQVDVPVSMALVWGLDFECPGSGTRS